ncbi:hypothetical protein LBMAG52_05440 [Planctomycetia bacterium]|nr:hypothetical protein LBMAG52_05440 [Planctomycetia bacterium]
MADSELETAVAPAEMTVAAEVPPISVTDETALLSSVKQQLEAARQSSQAAFDRVSEDLQRLQRPRPESTTRRSADVSQDVADSLAKLLRRQEDLENLLRESLPELLPADNVCCSELEHASPVPEWAVQWQAAFNEQFRRWDSRLQTFIEELRNRVPPPCPAPVIIAETAPPDPPPHQLSEPNGAASQTWLRVLLGNDLFDNSQLERSIHWIEQQALTDNVDALLLLGQLLVFRFSSADRKPMLLKEVGEALYRCFPKIHDERDRFEESLAAWLTKECEALGLPNSIELVHPGERFDASKHAPIERGGVEVARVLGWVVVRDGGRVFAKASVQTR